MRASAAVRARTLRASRSVSTVACAGGDAGRLPAHNNASAACGRDTQPVMSAVLAGASDDMARATWRQETVSARAVRGAARMLDMLLPPGMLQENSRDSSPDLPHVPPIYNLVPNFFQNKKNIPTNCPAALNAVRSHGVAGMAEVILLLAASSFGTISAAYAAASPDAFGVPDAQ